MSAPMNSLVKLEHTLGTLKRIHRRMQMRGVRLLQVARKGKSKPVLLYRAYTWEQASGMLELEMDNIKCQIEEINQTLT